MKQKLLGKTKLDYKSYAAFIIIVLIIILYFTHASYYLAYTLDYLSNRHKYHFKEESQYKDNTLTQTDSLLTTFMDYYRTSILEKMPVVKSSPVPEIQITELATTNLIELSHHYTQPFIIRGLIKDFDCVKKWDLDYFEKEYGDIEVPAFSVIDKTITYSKSDPVKMKQCNGGNFCSIKTICESIRLGEPLYINNISKLFTVSEQARKELNLDKMSEIMNQHFLTNPKNNEFMSQLFFGGKNTGTSLHSASNINFFFNVKGTKHWGFIDPKYTHLIHCQSSSQGLFAVSQDDFFDETEQNAFLKIPRYEALLNSGDFLFNPAWYWHAVKNKTEYTIAVANRYLSDVYIGSENMSIIRGNYFFTFLQMFSPSYYWKFLFFDKTKSLQYNYGNMVDKEIIDNVTNDDIL